jgi:hypothetical protein
LETFLDFKGGKEMCQAENSIISVLLEHIKMLDMDTLFLYSFIRVCDGTHAVIIPSTRLHKHSGRVTVAVLFVWYL